MLQVRMCSHLFKAYFTSAEKQTKNTRKLVWGIWVLLKYQTAVHLFAFLGLDLPQVELKLLALQDVAVCPATLARSGSDATCRKGGNAQIWCTKRLTHQLDLIYI